MQIEKNVLSEDKGATLVEYALLVALIAVASIGAMTLLATKVSEKFSTIGSSLQ
jgi:pilus assembly protein Flp/PilA